MPSRLPLPTVAELRQAFHDGARGTLDRRADTHDGANLDDLAGLSAIFWSREAARDADLFRATYLSGARGADLTARVKKEFGLDRALDSAGTGLAAIHRASAAAGGGTIWKGTRFRVRGAAIDTLGYPTATDTTVPDGALAFTVPIVAPATGPNYALDTVSLPAGTCSIDDPIWDNSWAVDRIVCSAGTAYEDDKALLARALQSKSDARPGYKQAIIAACKRAGAANVELYASNFAGDANDYGLNYVFVSDASFATPPTLIRACTAALESVRVAGASLGVFPMTTAPLNVDAAVHLWSDPGSLDTLELQNAMRAGLAGYLSARGGGFSYRLDAMAGAMSRSNAVRSIHFVSPTADLPLLSGSPPQLPVVLTKYALGTLNLKFMGPSDIYSDPLDPAW